MTHASDLVADLCRPWKHGEHLDGRGLVLDEPLVLDGLELRSFDLSGARFNGGISARGTRFLGLAWLHGATVGGDCDLRDARFMIDCRADGLVAGDVRLDAATVQGVLSLAGAQLGSLSLTDAYVMANLTLQDARVSGPVDLTRAEIMGGLWTAGAQLATLKVANAEISGRVRLPG